MLDNDEKISKWIEQMVEEGKTRNDIVRAEFVSKRPDGSFTTYKLSMAGKGKYNLKVHIGALNLDEMF